MSIGIWIFIFFLIYFGTAPVIAHLKYQNSRYGKLPQKKRYIGFWVRFGAGVADTILLIIIGFVVRTTTSKRVLFLCSIFDYLFFVSFLFFSSLNQNHSIH